MFTNIYINTRTAGAYGPLVLAPAEGMGALRTPCQVWVIFFTLKKNLFQLLFLLFFTFDIFNFF